MNGEILLGFSLLGAYFAVGFFTPVVCSVIRRLRPTWTIS